MHNVSLDNSLEILERSLEFKNLTKDDALLAIDLNFSLLSKYSKNIRDRTKNNVISYSRKVFINLINLCRDLCGYCTYKKEPDQIGVSMLFPGDVLSLVRVGRDYRCTEALFVTGERPETKYIEARNWLKSLGYTSTVEYICNLGKRVLTESGLLPHTNAGNISKREMNELRKTNASLGLMLETSSQRLTKAGYPHEFAPSKNPKARIKTLEKAGELAIPMTTGLLVGIGETKEEYIDSLFTIKKIHERFGNIQEIIIQNFSPKSSTNMERSLSPSTEYFLRCVSLARMIIPNMNIQVPPNLNYSILEKCIDAGINDWGGISPLTIDHVNPEFPWPSIDAIRKITESKGYDLKPRLPVYPEYIKSRFIDDDLMPFVTSLSNSLGLVKEEYLNEF